MFVLNVIGGALIAQGIWRVEVLNGLLFRLFVSDVDGGICRMNLADRIKTQTGLSPEDALEQGKYIIKATRKIKGIDEEKNQITITINDNSVDRDGDIVKPSSFKGHLDWYLDNPVVLFAHNHREPPIAKMVDYTLTDDKFVAVDQFAVDEYEFAATCWKLCAGGYMKSASVGFIPEGWEDPQDDDRPSGLEGIIYTKCELLEHSILPIGSNRNALIKIYQKTKGHWDPVVSKMIEKLIEQPLKLKCGHKVVYDADGNVIEPCPICDGMPQSWSAVKDTSILTTPAEILAWTTGIGTYSTNGRNKAENDKVAPNGTFDAAEEEEDDKMQSEKEEKEAISITNFEKAIEALEATQATIGEIFGGIRDLLTGIKENIQGEQVEPLSAESDEDDTHLETTEEPNKEEELEPDESVETGETAEETTGETENSSGDDDRVAHLMASVEELKSKLEE